MDNQQGNLQWLNIMDKYLEPLAYSIGALLGDGSVKRYTVKSRGVLCTQSKVAICNMDLDCIGRVCVEINNFFEKNYKVVGYVNPNGAQMHRLAINNSIIHELFYYFIREKLNLPDELFRADRQIRLDFLAGLFDADGYVAENKSPNSKFGVSWRVGYAARFRTLVEDVTRLLQKLGVKVGKIHEQVSEHGTLMFVIKPNIRSFIDAGCYFQIQRKAQRLLDYASAVRPSETIMPDPQRRVMI